MFARDDTPDGLYRDHREHRELIDAYVVELDPVVDGFSGVLVELYVLGSGVGSTVCWGHDVCDVYNVCEVHEIYVVYEVRKSALGSGNRLAVFSSWDERLARAAFEGEIGEGGLDIPASCGSPHGSSCGSRSIL